MRVVVVGIGAIGGPIAAHIAENKVDITVVTKYKDLAEIINSKGLKLQGKERIRSVPIKAVPLITDLKGKYDIIFLAMKTTGVLEAAKDILPLLYHNSVVVTLQNGIVEDDVAKIVGRERVIGAVVAWGSTMIEPGIIERTSDGVFFIGSIDSKKNKKRIKEVAELLEYCQPVFTIDNIYSALYSKLGINIAINGLSAISGYTIGGLANNPRAIQLFMIITSELMKIVKKLEIQLINIGSAIQPQSIVLSESDTPDTIQKKQQNIRDALKSYKEVKPSTLQSLERKQKSEVDYLNGYVTQKGEELGIPTPLNSAITQIIKEIESGKRIISPDNLLDLPLN